MPKSRAEYMKAYRLKNLEKLRAYEKLRNKKRASKPKESFKDNAKNAPECIKQLAEVHSKFLFPKPCNSDGVTPALRCYIEGCKNPLFRKGHYKGRIVDVCKEHYNC